MNGITNIGMQQCVDIGMWQQGCFVSKLCSTTQIYASLEADTNQQIAIGTTSKMYSAIEETTTLRKCD